MQIIETLLNQPDKDINISKQYIIRKSIVDDSDFINPFIWNTVLNKFYDTRTIYQELTLLYVATTNENEEIVDILLQP